MFFKRIFCLEVSGLLFFWPFTYFSVQAYDGFPFDVNDILEEKLMPARLFTEPFSEFVNIRSLNYTSGPQAFQDANEVNGSDFGVALSTMRFHRKMMNEFLATTFLAKELFTSSESSEDVWVARRIGTVPYESATKDNETSSSEMPKDTAHRKPKNINHHKLLMDEGSTNYKDWLERSTTLEDIHRQFESQRLPNESSMTHSKRNRFKGANNRRHSLSNPYIKIDVNNEDDQEEYEDGDITGYALSNSMSEPSQPRLNSPNHLYMPNEPIFTEAQSSIPLAKIVNKNGYETSYDSYAVPPPHPQTHPQPHPHPYSHPNPYAHPQSFTPTQPPLSALATIQNKEISLKDITDVALTTLAFLSFGMFILQVLMCITMGKDDSANMMMLPMEATDNGTDIPDDGTEEIRRRKKRSTRKERLTLMNDLARRVLHSINAVLIYSKDNGSCHAFSLCEHNRFARTQNNGQKLWIPVWR